MQVTIGANCWNGERRKALNVPASQVELAPDRVKGKLKWFKDPKVRAVVGFAIPLALLAHGLPPIGLSQAFAAMTSPATPAMLNQTFDQPAVPVLAQATADKIHHAFDPLIHLCQSLAYPIAGVMIAAGCIFIMVGNKERGMDMLKNAAIGYILVQLTPLFLDLLVGVGGSI